MSLVNPAFPSSQAFELINNALNESPAEKKEAIKKGGAIFAFTLKNKEGESDSWHIDLKDQGKVAKGDKPEGGKADGEFASVPPRSTEQNMCECWESTG
jgi:hypothetical protein